MATPLDFSTHAAAKAERKATLDARDARIAAARDAAVPTLATLVATIDDDFDADDPESVAMLLDYINVQCRHIVDQSAE